MNLHTNLYNLKVIVTDKAGNTAEATVDTERFNTAPVITPTITKDITVASNPLNSTSWIQIAANATDSDGDKLTIRIYFGTVASNNLNSSHLVSSQTNASSRHNTNKEE